MIGAAQASDGLVIVAIVFGVVCLLAAIASFDPHISARIPLKPLAKGNPAARVGVSIAGIALILLGIGG